MADRLHCLSVHLVTMSTHKSTPFISQITNFDSGRKKWQVNVLLCGARGLSCTYSSPATFDAGSLFAAKLNAVCFSQAAALIWLTCMKARDEGMKAGIQPIKMTTYA